jgi:hypothetical protein
LYRYLHVGATGQEDNICTNIYRELHLRPHIQGWGDNGKNRCIDKCEIKVNFLHHDK